MALQQEPLDVVFKNVRAVTPLLLPRDKPTDSIVQQVKAASGDGVDLVLDFAGASKTFDIGRKSLRIVN